MNKTIPQLDQLWDNLLSRQPDLIWIAYASLDAPEQKSVLAHLLRMASDSGWLPEQRDSAKVAVKALATQSKQEK
jgi:hypothetical protein